MPREAHLIRQINWKNELSRFGKVQLEKSISIGSTRIFADVYAIIDGRIYLIEIGDIANGRKEALLNAYVRQNRNIVFVHERYGENKINQVLLTISEFRESPDGKRALLSLHLNSKKHLYGTYGVILGIGAWITNLYVVFNLLQNMEAVNFLLIFGTAFGFLIYPLLGLIAGRSIAGAFPCNCTQCTQLRKDLASGFNVPTTNLTADSRHTNHDLWLGYHCSNSNCPNTSPLDPNTRCPACNSGVTNNLSTDIVKRKLRIAT